MELWLFWNTDSVRADGLLLRIRDANIGCFIIRLEARLQPNIGNIIYTIRFDGAHAFGYNFAEREPILMKSGALRVYFLGLAGRRIFWAQSVQSQQLQNHAKYFVFVKYATHDFWATVCVHWIILCRFGYLSVVLSRFWHSTFLFVAIVVCCRFGVAVLSLAVLVCRRFDHRPCRC